MRLLLIGVAILATKISFAAGPKEVARADQSLWPHEIKSTEAFNTASRAELLLFLSSYKGITSSDPTQDSLGIKKVNLDSIKKWKERSSIYWMNAYLDSAKDCKDQKVLGCSFKGTTFSELLVYAASFPKNLPGEYLAWVTMSEKFYSIYSQEQLRLAALFPNPTSEALPLDESEVFGDKFKDGDFLLTLDDGPTPEGGYTDKYTDLLRKESISATFFSLGNALEKRMLKSSPEHLRKLYDKQCLASHGYEHQSHQKWNEWKSSLEKVRALINKIDSTSALSFRPPYGQRSVELIAEQNQNAKSHVILWNIDSQDWHSKINANEVGDRVKKLMLLWRKGVILFHDVHPKALTAIPQLIEFAKDAHLNWVECHKIK